MPRYGFVRARYHRFRNEAGVSGNLNLLYGSGCRGGLYGDTELAEKQNVMRRRENSICPATSERCTGNACYLSCQHDVRSADFTRTGRRAGPKGVISEIGKALGENRVSSDVAIGRKTALAKEKSPAERRPIENADPGLAALLRDVIEAFDHVDATLTQLHLALGVEKPSPRLNSAREIKARVRKALRGLRPSNSKLESAGD